MSSAIKNITDSLLLSLNNWKPNKTKGGKGKATIGQGNILTPEESMKSDTARIDANKARRAAKAASLSSQTQQTKPEQPNT
jgi:hypothetical protein